MDAIMFAKSCFLCLWQFEFIKNGDSVDATEEAVQLVIEVKHDKSLGGFEIRNFSLNSPNVLLYSNWVQKKFLDLDGLAHIELLEARERYEVGGVDRILWRFSKNLLE